MAGTNINRVILTGNLTKDPDLRATNSGLNVCSLRLAVNNRRKDGATGQWVEEPNYFDVTVFGAQGENCARFLTKGRPVAVDGRLKWREFTDQQGNQRQAVEIIADAVQFLGGRDDSQGGGGGGFAPRTDVPVNTADFSTPAPAPTPAAVPAGAHLGALAPFAAGRRGRRPVPPKWPVNGPLRAATMEGVHRLVPDRPARRLGQLYAGLILYGLSLAMMVRAEFGLDPWDVLHQGISDRTGLSFGTVVMLTGAVVLLLWIPLRQAPGLGTISNVLVIGLSADAGLALLAAPDGLALRIALIVGGVGLNGLATAAYIGAGLGPGPRDGLMTGWVGRRGGSVRTVRTVIEVAVLLAGWGLGGTVGLGTVLYAVAIGPLVQLFLPRVTVVPPRRPQVRLRPSPAGAASR